MLDKNDTTDREDEIVMLFLVAGWAAVVVLLLIERLA